MAICLYSHIVRLYLIDIPHYYDYHRLKV